MRPDPVSAGRHRRRHRVSVATASIALLTAVLTATLPAQQGSGASRTISFRTDNGRTITALHVEAGRRPAPAVVLVPMLGRPKEDWHAVAAALAAADITALAIDLPGTVLPAEAADLAEWHAAIGAAVSYLYARPDVRGSSIGVAGASLGANLAVLAAASDARIRALALVSPSLDYRGVRIESALREYGERPALLLASRADPYAARTVRTLAANGPGPRETHWADVPAHGTVLLAREPALAALLAGWFQRMLGVN